MIYQFIKVLIEIDSFTKHINYFNTPSVHTSMAGHSAHPDTNAIAACIYPSGQQSGRYDAFRADAPAHAR